MFIVNMDTPICVIQQFKKTSLRKCGLQNMECLLLYLLYTFEHSLSI